jgi:hypothetical protein
MNENKNVSNFNKAVGQLLVNLAERWQDEKEFEDIKEYQTPIQTVATKFGITISGMTKRPFGCTFTTENVNYTLQAKLKSTSVEVVLFSKPV